MEMKFKPHASLICPPDFRSQSLLNDERSWRRTITTRTVHTNTRSTESGMWALRKMGRWNEVRTPTRARRRSASCLFQHSEHWCFTCFGIWKVWLMSNDQKQTRLIQKTLDFPREPQFSKFGSISRPLTQNQHNHRVHDFQKSLCSRV